MPYNSKAVVQARNYLRKELPQKFKACSKEATIYGLCVSEWDNLRKNDCQKEFAAFKQCVQQASIK